MNIDPRTLDASALAAYSSHVAQVTNEIDFVMRIIPDTVVDAFAKGDILQVLLVAILFGVGLALLGSADAPSRTSSRRWWTCCSR